jgi:PKD domain
MRRICSLLELNLGRCPQAACTAAPMLLAAILALSAATARPALAEIAPAGVIDGPSPTILDVDGAAMAPDGSGGILYRKLVEGEPHLFVARFLDGAWQAPVQVDAGQPFPATFPAIAAGDDGRLLVVWVEPWAVINQVTHYQLMSAELEPGAARFGPAQQVDPKDVGDGSAAYPSLAMAPDGRAYVAYRVVTNSLVGSTIVPLRPGDELISVRVARYNGEGVPWTSLGTINAHPELTMRHPSASNAPVIGVDLAGNAVVVWQEPDSTGTARIWARRIFGARLGNVLQVSPESANGAPITAEADAPALAVGPYGEARIAYRLSGGSGSPYGSARILLNALPSEVAPNGAKLLGASVVGGANALGPPSVAIDPTGHFRVAYVGEGDAQELSGNDFAPATAPAALGPATGSSILTTIDPSGGGVSAWPALSGTGLPVIDAREDFADGAWQLAELSAPLSGPTGPPVLGASGEGDALIAFSQGPADQQQVMAAVAKAPPGSFLAIAPVGWVRGSSVKISWNPPAEAFGATTYALVIDGQITKSGLRATSARIDPRGLGEGVHAVQVLAVDGLGQQTMTPVAELKVDANPPRVSVRSLAHDAVRVRVYSRASGVVASATTIAFGDGTRAHGASSVHHSYARPGRYELTVRSRDHAGNRLDAHIWVQVG